MVEYIDGSVISQLSIPDMKIPIAYGLGYPVRIESGVKEIDFHNLKPITFRDPDLTKFPSINLARQAIDEGGTLPAILNAANEEGVKSFLAKEIGFTQIMEIVSSVINTIGSKPIDEIEDVFESDLTARKEALKVIKSLNGNN
jgi:1-deoxy-D-xylulose-5-phosphate reductoisomerase